MSYQLVLATDLDGTFLEGNYNAKSFFYNELVRLHEEVLLIYVTGRTVEDVEHYCRQGYLPFAHYLICDHGTQILDGHHFHPIVHLQNPIIQRWNNSNRRLKEMLESDPGLQPQPYNPPYRVAYYYDPNRLQKQTLQKIDDAGFDYILSNDVYLDIVPRGVSKGSSLLKIMQDLQLDPASVITSGDSLNDLSLFQTGLKGIAVANSEPKLVEEIENMDNVYHSTYPGIWGIVDGLKFYDKFALFQEPAIR